MSEPAAIRQLTTVLAFAYPFLAHLATFNFALAARRRFPQQPYRNMFELLRHTLAAMPRLIGRVQ